MIEANKLILVNGLPTQIGVYVAPPNKPKEAVNFPYEVAVNTEGFDPSTLDPLLERVGGVA